MAAQKSDSRRREQGNEREIQAINSIASLSSLKISKALGRKQVELTGECANHGQRRERKAKNSIPKKSYQAV
jgi:hypothetical protein